MSITTKKYRCSQCGHVQEQETNHYGATWSWGHFAVCPNCPPYKKYPEFGGQTVWECMETEHLTNAEKGARAGFNSVAKKALKGMEN